jgi:hypothetical protein
MGAFRKAAPVVWAALLLLAGCGEDPFAAGDWKSASAAGVTLEWRVDGDDLALRVSAETTGWVAAGFDPEYGMESANIVIGYVSGSARVRDDWGVSEDQHASDTSLGGFDDVLESDGTETDGVTEIEALIPLDSGDIFDKPLVPGGTYTVILARGADGSDDYSSQHAAAGSVTIEL